VFNQSRAADLFVFYSLGIPGVSSESGQELEKERKAPERIRLLEIMKNEYKSTAGIERASPEELLCRIGSLQAILVRHKQSRPVKYSYSKVASVSKYFIYVSQVAYSHAQRFIARMFSSLVCVISAKMVGICVVAFLVPFPVVLFRGRVSS
jgi:hypothetical protein